MEGQASAVQTSYDRVAAAYAAHYLGELAYKPLDRALLDCFAEEVRGRGPVGDVGCGPGHVARYLHERGLAPVGVDLSAGMVAQARRHHPALDFRQGDMLDLDAADGAWAGLVALYAIVHLVGHAAFKWILAGAALRSRSPQVIPIYLRHDPLEPAQVRRALAEFYRVLRPGGLLLLSFHVGQERRHLDELLGQPVALDFLFFERPAVEGWVEEAGFLIQACLERRPYAPHEVATHRAYLLARKPATRHGSGQE